jgi:hypothetical protein
MSEEAKPYSSGEAAAAPAVEEGAGAATGNDSNWQAAAVPPRDTHTYITSITRIIPERLPQLKAVLAGVQGSYGSPIQQISTIHFARWVIIDNGTRLLFCSNFDGTWEDYIDEFIEKASGGLDAIWSSCEGFPAGGSKDVEAFKKYVRDSEISQANTFVYTAYPEYSVKDILKALRIQKRLEALLDEIK